MQKHLQFDVKTTSMALALFLVACGDEKSPDSAADTGETTSATPDTPSAANTDTDTSSDQPFDPQTPPTTVEALEQWLAEGYYKSWTCEDAPNTKSDGASAIHVHGAKTRVCANVLLAASQAPGTSGEFPKGVAAVKEVYDDNGDLDVTVVSVKTKAASDGGDAWYWYETPSLQGFGFGGCTGCHSAAASDDDHPGAGDYVYFQTKTESELPPIGDAATVQAWLDSRAYLNWDCEAEPSVKAEGAAAIHAHTKNRICVNAKLAAHDPTNGPWPAGVAAVKELYADDSDAMTGAVLYTKVASESASGDGWFWFAGEGATGFGLSACTTCHGAAGSDDDHPGAGDYVYNRP